MLPSRFETPPNSGYCSDKHRPALVLICTYTTKKKISFYGAILLTPPSPPPVSAWNKKISAIKVPAAVNKPKKPGTNKLKIRPGMRRLTLVSGLSGGIEPPFALDASQAQPHPRDERPREALGPTVYRKLTGGTVSRSIRVSEGINSLRALYVATTAGLFPEFRIRPHNRSCEQSERVGNTEQTGTAVTPTGPQIAASLVSRWSNQ